MGEDRMMAFAGREPTPRMPAVDLVSVRVSHDAEGDLLQLKLSGARAALTMDWRDGISLRVNPETGEIYCVEIEDFATHYLERHPEIAAAWAKLGTNASGELPENVRVPFVKRILKQADLLGTRSIVGAD